MQRRPWCLWQLFSWVGGQDFFLKFSPFIFINYQQHSQQKKKPKFLQHRHWFPNEKRSEEPVKKFHTDDPDLDSASNWLKQISLLQDQSDALPRSGQCFCKSCCERNQLQPIRSTSQIWVVMYHQQGFYAVFPQTSFHRETSGQCCNFASITKYRKIPKISPSMYKPLQM